MDYLDAPSDGPVKERRALTVVESSLVIQAAIGTEMEAPVKVLLATGLRSGELRGLRWSDIDREKLALKVSRTVFEVNSKYNNGVSIGVGVPKTRRAIRTVEISAALLAELDRHHLEQQIGSALNPVVNDDEQDLIFPDKNGKLWRMRYFLEDFKKVVLSAKIENPEEITPHYLRHTHASLAIQNGMDLFYLSRRLGHTNISTTANRYSHMYSDNQRAGAEVIDEILIGETNG